MSAALDPVLLADDLQLLWYDPIDGSPALRSGRTGVGSLERIHTLGAAVLVDLLLHGGAELVPDKPSRLRLEAQARGLAAPSALVAASASAPLLRELEPARIQLRRLRKPRPPEKVLPKLRPRHPEARLVAAGIIEYPADSPRRLTQAGAEFARSRRAALDDAVLEGTRPTGGLDARTLSLAALLSFGDAWGAAYPRVSRAQRPQLEDRLARLRAEAEAEGRPDGAIWRVVGGGLRRANAPV